MGLSNNLKTEPDRLVQLVELKIKSDPVNIKNLFCY